LSYVPLVRSVGQFGDSNSTGDGAASRWKLQELKRRCHISHESNTLTTLMTSNVKPQTPHQSEDWRYVR